MSEDKKLEESVEDSELNDLLDSALEDFNKISTLDIKEDNGSTSNSGSSNDKKNIPLGNQENFRPEDLLKQAKDMVDAELPSSSLEGLLAYQMIAKDISDLYGDKAVYDDNVTADIRSAIALGLEDLSNVSENLQNDSNLASMLSQVSLGEGSGGILPFMQGMMQSLLSKEILYPSLKELVDKYPEWLEQKKDTLASADLQKYTKQLELMQKVCSELEKEKDTDTEEIKNHRFEKILLLMENMQTYGQPPEELVGEQPAFFQFDADGNPIMPTLPPGENGEVPQNCCVM